MPSAPLALIARATPGSIRVGLAAAACARLDLPFCGVAGNAVAEASPLTVVEPRTGLVGVASRTLLPEPAEDRTCLPDRQRATDLLLPLRRQHRVQRHAQAGRVVTGDDPHPLTRQR